MADLRSLTSAPCVLERGGAVEPVLNESMSRGEGGEGERAEGRERESWEVMV